MNALTVVELKKLAKSKGIKGYSKLRKSELLSALNRSPSRSKSPKVRKSKSRSGKRRSVKRSRSRSVKRRSVKRRSGKRRSVKSPKSRSANRRYVKKDYTISIKPYFVKNDEDNYVPSDAEIGKFIQEHAVEEIKKTIDDIEIFNNVYTGRMGVKFLSYNPSTRTLFFKVPGKYPRKQVEDFVDGLRDFPLEDTAYEGMAGKGLILPQGGEIDFRKAVKLT
jgi:hypothetical protein